MNQRRHRKSHGKSAQKRYAQLFKLTPSDHPTPTDISTCMCCCSFNEHQLALSMCECTFHTISYIEQIVIPMCMQCTCFFVQLSSNCEILRRELSWAAARAGRPLPFPDHPNAHAAYRNMDKGPQAFRNMEAHPKWGKGDTAAAHNFPPQPPLQPRPPAIPPPLHMQKPGAPATPIGGAPVMVPPPMATAPVPPPMAISPPAMPTSDQPNAPFQISTSAMQQLLMSYWQQGVLHSMMGMAAGLTATPPRPSQPPLPPDPPPRADDVVSVHGSQRGSSPSRPARNPSFSCSPGRGDAPPGRGFGKFGRSRSRSRYRSRSRSMSPPPQSRPGRPGSSTDPAPDQVQHHMCYGCDVLILHEQSMSLP